MKNKASTFLLASLFLASGYFFSGCQNTCERFDPQITYYPTPCIIDSRPSAFPPLTAENCRTDWGKELRLAYAFSQEQDYYRAITAFKSALVFLPSSRLDEKKQIEYGIVQSYYLGCKFREAIEIFESSDLLYIGKEFPPYHDLLIMLYESYLKIDNTEKACKMLELISIEFPSDAEALNISTAFIAADLPGIQQNSLYRPDRSDMDDFIDEYLCAAKSEQSAQLYQALLPGAGYLYVGQKNAARTSFLINLLFTWAAYQFFDRGYIAAGLITASLETGWYIGGINGARLAAKEYNERLFGINGREFMRCHQLFPILMLETTF